MKSINLLVVLVCSVLVACGGGKGSSSKPPSSASSSVSSSLSSSLSSSYGSSDSSPSVSSSSVSSDPQLTDFELANIRAEVFAALSKAQVLESAYEGDKIVIDYSANELLGTITPTVYNDYNDGVGGFSECYIKSTLAMAMGALNGATLYYNDPSSVFDTRVDFTVQTANGLLRLEYNFKEGFIQSVNLDGGNVGAGKMLVLETLDSFDEVDYQSNPCERFRLTWPDMSKLGSDLVFFYDATRIYDGATYKSYVLYLPVEGFVTAHYNNDEWTQLYGTARDCWTLNGGVVNSSLVGVHTYRDSLDSGDLYFEVGSDRYYLAYDNRNIYGFKLNSPSSPRQVQIGTNHELSLDLTPSGVNTKKLAFSVAAVTRFDEAKNNLCTE